MSDATKSCFDCVNFIPSEVVPSSFGKGINAGICGAKMEIVQLASKDIATNRRLARTKAAGCKIYNVPTASPQREQVSLGFPKVHVPSSSLDKSQRPKSCRACKHFIHEDEVLTETTIAAPGCAARGKALLPDKLTTIAAKCNQSEMQSWHQTTPLLGDSIQLLPELQQAFQLTEAEAHGDPLTHESDQEVTAEDASRGILAWREVFDDSNNRSVMLPIFDPHHFDEAERSLIPRPGDDERPELYLDHGGFVYTLAIMWLKLEQTPALWGQPGTGKTELLRHMAFLMQVPFWRINITDSTEIDELIGKMKFVNQETVFQYGTLPNRWDKIGVLCIDEPNVGPPDVWQVLRPLTDNSKQLVITQNDGERIKRHEFCFLGLAMNPAWHPLNVGTRELGAADVSRILHLTLELPSKDLEKKIISERVASHGHKLEKTDLDRIMAIADDIRRMSADGEIPITWGIREQIKVALMWNFFEPEKVYELAIADFLDPEQRNVLISGAVSGHVSRR